MRRLDRWPRGRATRTRWVPAGPWHAHGIVLPAAHRSKCWQVKQSEPGYGPQVIDAWRIGVCHRHTRRRSLFTQQASQIRVRSGLPCSPHKLLVPSQYQG